MDDNCRQYFDAFTRTMENDVRAEYYNPFIVRHRKKTTKQQLDILEKNFETNTRPDARMRKILSDQLGMSMRCIQVWFQNRRAKEKKVAERKFRCDLDSTNYFEQRMFIGSVNIVFNAANNKLYESPIDLVNYNSSNVSSDFSNSADYFSGQSMNLSGEHQGEIRGLFDTRTSVNN